MTVAGRMGVRRDLGKMSFLHLQDDGGKIQVQIRKDVVGDDQYALLELLAHGDFLGATGEVMRTRTGEVTVKAESIVPLARAIDYRQRGAFVEQLERRASLDVRSVPGDFELGIGRL